MLHNVNYAILVLSNTFYNLLSVSVLCPLAEESQGIALKRIVELCGHKEIYPEILLQVHFITENCPRHVTNLTSLEATHDPLACTVYNTMEDLRAYLKAGTTTNSFVPESDRLLGKLKGQEKTKVMKALKKLLKHFDDYCDAPVKETHQEFANQSNTPPFTIACSPLTSRGSFEKYTCLWDSGGEE